jgi:CID domain
VAMSHLDVILAEFAALFGRLRDHPDKNLILDLTKFCERNIAIAAPQFSDLIIARVIDPAIPPTWILPVFYLMDAIMKHVGGNYPILFSRHLGVAFERCFDQLSPKDKGKLDFLLGTWEERRLLPPEVLAYMRKTVATKKQLAGTAAMGIAPGLSGPVPGAIPPAGILPADDPRRLEVVSIYSQECHHRDRRLRTVGY